MQSGLIWQTCQNKCRLQPRPPAELFYSHSAGQWNFSADIRPAEHFCGRFVADLFSADFQLCVKLKLKLMK